jgi:signal transduction histidine kinase/CheY-like chemotaxis protein
MSHTHFHAHSAPLSAEALDISSQVRILAAVGGRVGAARASLLEYFLEGGRPLVRLRADWRAGGPSAADPQDEALAASEVLPQLNALRSGNPFLAASAAGGGLWWRLYLPLAAGGQLRGLLRVDNVRAWEPSEVALLQGAATVLAEMLEPAPAGALGRPRKPERFLEEEDTADESSLLEERALQAQRLNLLGKLAGGVAHDLNNMLTPIRLGIDLLQEDPPAEERARLLAAVRSSADQAAAVVQQILTFARGSGPGRHEPLQVEALLVRAEQVLRYAFPKSITVEREVAQPLWTVRGDDTQLFQMLINLCVNARDAMPRGGTLRLSASNVMLRKESPRPHPEARPGPYVLVQVSDTGCGIPPEVVDRIFEPFFTTKEVGKGTGLGLSTALAIARNHGAWLGVESTPGRGSCFSLYLPVTDAEPSTEAEAGAPPIRGRGELILLVDDEASIRDVVRVTLETFGYRVLCAAGGAEALRLYEQQRQEVALVLVDLMMPGMDGLATIRGLMALDPQVRIIAASGTLPPTLTQAPELQQVTFLRKPYRAQQLLEVLRTLLDTVESG